MGVQLGLDLSVFSTLLRINFSGNKCDERTLKDFTSLWTRCQSQSSLEPTVEIDIVISSDDRVRQNARQRGAFAFGGFHEAASALSGLVTLASIEHAPAELLLLHSAGIAESETGKVIGLIGPSGMGKTTSALKLAHLFAYITDETLAVDPLSGSVSAFPKPLSIINSENSRVKTQYSPDELGLVKTPQDLSLHGLLFLDRNPEFEGPPIIKKLEVLEAIEMCVPHTSYLLSRDKPLEDLVTLFKSTPAVQKVTYRDSDDLVPIIQDILDIAVSNTTFLQSIPESINTNNSSFERVFPFPQPSNLVNEESNNLPEAFFNSPHHYQLWALPLKDMAYINGASVVCSQSHVAVIEEMGLFIYETCLTGQDFEKLVRELIARFGSPDSKNIESMVINKIGELNSIGLIAAVESETVFTAEASREIP